MALPVNFSKYGLVPYGGNQQSQNAQSIMDKAKRMSQGMAYNTYSSGDGTTGTSNGFSGYSDSYPSTTDYANGYSDTSGSGYKFYTPDTSGWQTPAYTPTSTYRSYTPTANQNYGSGTTNAWDKSYSSPTSGWNGNTYGDTGQTFGNGGQPNLSSSRNRLGYSSGGAGSTTLTPFTMSLIKSQEDAWKEAQAREEADKSTALTNLEAQLKAFSANPVSKQMGSLAQQYMGQGLTESQKAAAGSAMRDIGNQFGQAALARGTPGAGQADYNTAVAQGAYASKLGDVVRNNQMQGASLGSNYINDYWGNLMKQRQFIEGTIRPSEYTTPNYNGLLSQIGNANAPTQSSATAGAANGTPQRDYSQRKGWITVRNPVYELGIPTKQEFFTGTAADEPLYQQYGNL